MTFGILGPLRVQAGDTPVLITAPKQRTLLAMLLARASAGQALMLFGHHERVTALSDDLPSPRHAAALPPLTRGIELLCRFYDPSRGAILWDGVDIRQVPPAELRARMGVLFQDYMSYDLTAAENIGVGEVEALADRPRIEAAAAMAGAHDTVQALPRGYDTMLSRIFFGPEEDAQTDAQAGVLLSGGQWQRLALARAMVRGRRDLLILDEPSSGLDAQAEYDVHRRLREHRAGLTSLLVSHRLGAVRDADLIVVLDEGRIIEQGAHDT